MVVTEQGDQLKETAGGGGGGGRVTCPLHDRTDLDSVLKIAIRAFPTNARPQSPH